MERYKSQSVEELIEGESKKNPDVLAGYTRSSKLVNFVGPKEIIGKRVLIKINQTKTWSLYGELIEVLSGQEVGVL